MENNMFEMTFENLFELHQEYQDRITKEFRKRQGEVLRDSVKSGLPVSKDVLSKFKV